MKKGNSGSKGNLKHLISIFVCFLFMAGCASLEHHSEEQVSGEQIETSGEEMMIANFNTGTKPNLLDGDFGAWDKDPADTTQTCRAEFDPDVKVGERGYSMRLEYDVESSNPAYNGFWMKLNGADFSSYSKLSFWVKGDKKAGFTPRIKVELKNKAGDVGKYVLSNITERWQKKTILFKEFRGLTDLTRMDEYVVVFDDRTSNPKTGIIYIDNIYVE